MIDISAVGASVTISFGSGDKVEITEFSDEGTPFECPDVDLSTNQKNLNGQMISSRTPSVYPVSVTVIPNSWDDIFLQRKAQNAALMPGSIQSISSLKIDSIILTIPSIDESGAARNSMSTTAGRKAVSHTTYKWTNGRMKSAPTGPSTSADGRLSARTYTFEMEKFEISSYDKAKRVES